MSASQIVCVTLPVRIVSEANSRDHWRKASARKKLHRACAHSMLLRHPLPATDGKVTITMTRIAPRTLDDDNLASGFKATRDGIADWLGIDDGSKRLRWVCEQRKGKQYGAEVAVEWDVELCPA